MAQPLEFYDVSMAPPVQETCSSVNPWKTRYALNFKAVPHVDKFVQLPDIKETRAKFGIPVCRHFADGSEFATLPIVIDPNTGSKLGDSYDIALHLHDNYPSGGNLFPEQELPFHSDASGILVPLSEGNFSRFPAYAAFNKSVDALFTNHVGLMVVGLKWDPISKDATVAEFIRRTGGALKTWEEFDISDETRKQLM